MSILIVADRPSAFIMLLDLICHSWPVSIVSALGRSSFTRWLTHSDVSIISTGKVTFTYLKWFTRKNILLGTTIDTRTLAIELHSAWYRSLYWLLVTYRKIHTYLKLLKRKYCAGYFNKLKTQLRQWIQITKYITKTMQTKCSVVHAQQPLCVATIDTIA